MLIRPELRTAATWSRPTPAQGSSDPADTADLRLRSCVLDKPKDVETGLQHGWPIEDITWTSDNRILSSESFKTWGSTAKIRKWSPATGEVVLLDVQRADVSPGPVASAPDGRVAVGWEDGTFSIFSPEGKEIAHRAHTGASVPDAEGVRRDTDDVRALAFSPDGSRLAVGGHDGRLVLWRGREPERLFQHDDWVTDVAFTPDGSKLITRFRGGMAVWDANTGQKLHHFPDTELVGGGGMALSRDGRKAAVIFSDATKVFDVETGAELDKRKIRGAHRLAFTPDGSHLLVGETFRNTVHDWNLATGECEPQELASEHGAISASGIRDIEVSPDGQMMAISFMDYSLSLWTQNAYNTDLGNLAEHLKPGASGGQVKQLGGYVIVGGARVKRK